MSRAFIREQNADNFEDLPERFVSEHPNDVTQLGMAQIEAAFAAAREAYALRHHLEMAQDLPAGKTVGSH